MERKLLPFRLSQALLNTSNSHVNKTGEIKDFVITEESGIAKGIRRIVAVTGNEAAEVRRVADGLKARLDQLEAMQGKEKDAGLKAYQVVREAFSRSL